MTCPSNRLCRVSVAKTALNVGAAVAGTTPKQPHKTAEGNYLPNAVGLDVIST
jgi:hypothetical protein